MGSFLHFVSYTTRIPHTPEKNHLLWRISLNINNAPRLRSSNGDEIVNDARRVTLLTGQMHAKWRFRAHTKHPVDRIVIHPLRLRKYQSVEDNS